MPRLAFGGKYFIEDLHTSYLDIYGGGFRTNTSAHEFFKNMADGLNLDHFTAALAGDQLQRVEMINGQVCRISFYNALVVFEKYCEPKTLRFPRVLAGEQLKVTGAMVFSEAVVADADNFRLFGGSAKPIINAALHAVRQSAGQHYHALQTVAAAEHVAKSALRALTTEPGIPIAPEPRRFWRWLAFLTPLTQSTGL